MLFAHVNSDDDDGGGGGDNGEKEGLNEREIHLYHAMHVLTRDVCN